MTAETLTGRVTLPDKSPVPVVYSDILVDSEPQADGVAAMIQTSRTVSAQPTAGIGLELDIIAAVVIGGANLSGGIGSITGTIVGTLLIMFLRNGCTLLGISTNVQLIVIGAIIIAAVTLDQLAKSKAASSTTA